MQKVHLSDECILWKRNVAAQKLDSHPAISLISERQLQWVNGFSEEEIMSHVPKSNS